LTKLKNKHNPTILYQLNNETFKKGLVSVIMPVYNSEKFIAESIVSVQAQTNKDWELIIVDDGSTDQTSAIAKQYAEKDLRIKYIYQENGKQGKARNNGIKNSCGEYIAFIDSDDLWVSNKLEKQIEALQKYEVDLIFSDGYIFMNNINNIQGDLNSLRGFFTPEQGLHHLLIANRIPILSVLVKKEKILQAGTFEEVAIIQNIEDYHLWLKVLANGSTIYGLPEKLVYYRRHESQVTNSDPLFYKRILWMFDSVKNDYPVLTKKIHKAQKRWGIEWFLNKASTKEEAIALIRDLNTIPSLTHINAILRLVLFIAGLSASKFFLKVLNKTMIF
jgi:teichuronic acid biosynthesis glycosyltransferase TuaG